MNAIFAMATANSPNDNKYDLYLRTTYLGMNLSDVEQSSLWFIIYSTK